jgi:hypothetical protein
MDRDKNANAGLIGARIVLNPQRLAEAGNTDNFECWSQAERYELEQLAVRHRENI